MDKDEKAKINEAYSSMQSRVLALRRRSMLVTLVPLIGVGIIVLLLARDVSDRIEGLKVQANDLKQEVEKRKGERESLEEENKKLKKENEQLEERKQSLKEFIERQRDRHVPMAGAAAPPSVVLSEQGAIPETFDIVPRAKVTMGREPNGRPVINVRFSLDIPEAHHALIENVTYQLNEAVYPNSALVSKTPPTFAVELMVYECVGTALATVKLQNGSIKTIAFDWCKEQGWPQKEAAPPELPSSLPIFPDGPRRPPGIVPLPRRRP